MEIIKPNLSFNQWREKIIRIFYIIIAWIFIVEAVVFFTLRNRGLIVSEGLTDSRYLITYVVAPAAINAVLVLVCQRINTLNIKNPIKNYAIVLTSSIISTVIAYVHYDVYSILTVFCLPVFLTILFGQKKMTVLITGINATLLILSMLHSFSHNDAIYFYLHFAVALTLLFVAALISSVLIAYNKANSDYIYSSYQTQLSLREQVRMDSLTGLYNQKTFHSLLKACLEKAKKTMSPMSLAIIDIDYFKEINDTFGHLAGDQVLLQFTHLMKNQCHNCDSYISRYGGDEFAVIFQGSSKELACLRLETLRQRCSQVSSVKTGVSQISFSAGIAEYMGGEADMADSGFD